MASLIFIETTTPRNIIVRWRGLFVRPSPSPVDNEQDGDFGDWYELPRNFASMMVTIGGVVTGPEIIIEGSSFAERGAIITQTERSAGVPTRITTKGVDEAIISRPRFIRPHYRAGNDFCNITLEILL